MENNSSLYQKLLKENVAKVNNLLGKLLWVFLVLLGSMYFFVTVGVLKIKVDFILKWCLCIVIINVISIILKYIKVSENVLKYYMILGMQIALIFGATDIRVEYHILYILVPIVSCAYFDKKLTAIVSTIAFICMNICIFYTSADRVANVFVTYTRIEYFISQSICRSVEFIALLIAIWLLVTRTGQVMVNLTEKNQSIIDMQQRIISSFAGLIESRDDDTGQHVKRTELFVDVIIESLKEKKVYVDEMQYVTPDIISRAAQLHDIGKLKISDNILCKKGALTKDEYEMIKVHTYEGKEIIERYLDGVEEPEFINEAKNIALSHHERWDGKGYPHGLKEKEIPISARIMAVADVFDALVSKRCYKDAVGLDEAFDIIEEEAGKQFDPEIVRTFLLKKDKIKELYKDSL